jgi:hypothetical protein
MTDTDRCDACDRPWAVKFEWSYTSEERYCLDCLLEPIDTDKDTTLLDFMPDCDDISHRLTPDGRIVRYTSVAAIYPILTGRLA